MIASGSTMAQDGTLKFYYPDGKLESEITYIKNVLNGYSIWYYNNGNKRKEVYYSDGKPDGFVKYYYENGLVSAEFSVKDGVRDGITKFYYPNGALKEVRSYEKGRLVKSLHLEYDSTYIAPLEAYEGAESQIKNRKKDGEFLCEAEFCPEPIGGMQAIKEHLIYPKHAKLYGLEGKVILKVHVDKKGNTGQIEVLKSLGLGCDEAAIDAVRKVHFLPGQNEGKAVDTWVVMSINFKLNSEKENKTVNIKPELETPEFAFDEFPEEVKEEPSSTIAEVSTDSNIVLFNQKEPEVAITELNQNENKNYQISETVTEKKNSVPEKEISAKEETYSSDQIKLLSCDAEECPEPKGGVEKIKENLFIPTKVKKLKLEGTVIVEAEIDQYGYVRDTHVIQKMGHGCDESAEVAILDTHFTPAKNNGKKVRCKLKIAIPFSYKK